jgi:hypothetical protein
MDLSNHVNDLTHFARIMKRKQAKSRRERLTDLDNIPKRAFFLLYINGIFVLNHSRKLRNYWGDLGNDKR